MSLLDGINILDLTIRLPGPLAGHLLAQLGAKVTKIEDEKFQDPFALEFVPGDESFKDWYHQLNHLKQVERFDWSSESEKFHQFLRQTDAILLAVPNKVKQKLGINKEKLSSINPNLVVIEIIAGEFGPLHDLNALALAGLLPMHLLHPKERIEPPPMIPVAGVSLGQILATSLCAGLVKKARQESIVWHEVDLLETVENVLAPFYSKKLRQEKRFLHNGRYICYNLYRTKDGSYLAVAAVEEKFWTAFCRLFKIPLELDDRFCLFDSKEAQIIADRIGELCDCEIKDLLKNQNICVHL